MSDPQPQVPESVEPEPAEVEVDVPAYARFIARQPVRWLTPREIAAGAFGEFFGGLFARFADSRDRIDLLREPVYPRPGDPNPPPAPTGDETEPTPADESHAPEQATFHYVADVGDGFGPTFAIARSIAQDDPEVLIFGGDQTYPSASTENYRDRTLGPYNLAFAMVDEESDPPRPGSKVPVYAIPGNHDWYDGLGAYLDAFTVTADGADDVHDDCFRRTQTRSYFAAKVAPQWWVWGIDIGFDGEVRVSQEQIEYFKTARRDHLDSGDAVIICVAEPVWLRRRDPNEITPDGWERFVAFLWDVFDDTGPWPTVRLVLTGDKHFYACHEPQQPVVGPTLVTAGGGGAYLSSTLGAPTELNLELTTQDHDAELTTRYDRSSAWPSDGDARRIGWFGGLIRWPLLNPGFNAIFSLIYGLFAFVGITGWRRPSFVEAERPISDTLDTLDAVAWFWDPAIWDWSVLRAALRLILVGPAVTLGGLVFVLVLLGAIFVHGMTAARRHSLLAAWLAGPLHIALHAVGLSLTCLLAAKVSWDAESASTNPTWGFALFGLAVVVTAGPEIINKVLYGVAEWGQLWYLAPPGIVLGLLVAAEVSSSETGGLTYVAVAAVVGGAIGPMASAVFFVMMQPFRIGLNELFVGIRHTGYKHFIRFTLTAGEARAEVVGLRRTRPMGVRWHRGAAVVQPLAPWLPESIRRRLAVSHPEVVHTFTVERVPGGERPESGDGSVDLVVDPAGAMQIQ